MKQQAINMVKLTDVRQTKVIELPSYPGSKITIYDSPLMKDTLSLNDLKENDYIKIFNIMVKDWNFEGDDGKILPIDEKNVSSLKSTDVVFLMEQITEFASFSKKKIERIIDICIEMGWTQRQLYEENTADFISELVTVINKRKRKNG